MRWLPLDPSLPRIGSHIPALDGVRGLAIGLVLVAHFTTYGGMQAAVFLDKAYYLVAAFGGIGVDLFFVLSGFLITGILVDAKGSPVYFRSFYMRRVLRIFPLYYGALAVFFFVIPRLTPDDPALHELLGEQAWYWSYLANVRMALEGWPSYHAIGHFWSLAVEEQFYMVWPLVVFLLPRRSIPWMCVACIVGALGFRVLFWQLGWPPAINILTTHRMDTLTLGALLAVLARRPGGMAALTRWLPPLGLAAGAVVMAMMVWDRGWVPQLVFYRTIGRSLVAVAFGGLLVAALTAPRRSIMGWFFNHPVMIFLGVYSYGLYVIHHPLIIFMSEAGLTVRLLPTFMGSYLPGQLLVHLVATLACVPLAWLSYRFYEQPFLKLKRLFPYRN